MNKVWNTKGGITLKNNNFLQSATISNYARTRRYQAGSIGDATNKFPKLNRVNFFSIARQGCTTNIRFYSANPPNKNVPEVVKDLEMKNYQTDMIRNFSIIAHIDHGKSTLADRLLEFTGTISKGASNKQVLDKLPVERQRGITVKAQSASMFYNYKGKKYLINLIDTPGHVDFTYEVSRSLSACQGTVLLVDAAQGIQAQTVANFYLAFSQDLVVIPVLNKVDLPGADPENTEKQLVNTFEFSPESMIRISAKSGLNVEKVMEAVVEQIPPPVGDRKKPLRALLFDTWYDIYAGVVCLVSVADGSVKRGDKIVSVHTGERYEVTQVGIMSPDITKTETLNAGQVGYILCGMKSISEAFVGDTFHLYKKPVEPFPGFKQPKPMVFAGLFPSDTNEFEKVQEAIEQLTLNDSSVTVNKENSNALGQGWRLGFLGTLHMDVFKQRLEEEHGVQVLLSNPTVPYKVVHEDGTEYFIKSPSDFPDKSKAKNNTIKTMEPYVTATIIVPDDYLGQILKLISSYRGNLLNHIYIDETRVMVKSRLPSGEIVTDFYDRLKSVSSGFATLDYEEAGYESADLIKMEVLINGEPVDALAAVMHKGKVEYLGRDIAKRLKELIKRQLFDISIQTTCNGRVIARETVKALRKDVTAKCYGGDVTRKMKLLNKQKEGKKRLKVIGRVEVPHEAFISLLTKDKK